MSGAAVPFLQHHFTTGEQQADASKIGMWLFLVTEILLFGGLFAGFAIMQSLHPQAFLAAHHELDRTLGFINTVVLLASSFSMVMAVHSARVGRRKPLVGWLVLTLALAGTFLGIKYKEYSHKFHEGLLPGRFYSHGERAAPGAAGPVEAAGRPAFGVAPGKTQADAARGAAPQGQAIFFSFYFLMTGLHGFHILAGMGAIGWVLRRSLRGDFSSAYNTPVDLVGLYWHLVDLIWIYLFPLLYLIK